MPVTTAYLLAPGGSCWIDQLGYNIQMGACTGLRQAGDGPQQVQGRSSVE